MKVIIPVAGIGSRLAPLTHTVPKVLISVAGKPMLGHNLDKLKELKSISEVIFIVGYLGELVKKYVRKNYNFNTKFIEQTERKGLGHAIYLAKGIFKDSKGEPLLIILGDTLFELDSTKKLKFFGDGSIAVKEVKNPERFGIVEIDSNGFITKLVEKPKQPVSNLAIVGIYYFKYPDKLFNALDYIIKNDIKTGGEYQLTDAMAIMIKNGAKLKAELVERWYDCGKPETLLDTNKHLLLQKGSICKGNIRNSVIIPPVNIDETTFIDNSVIGPYVSITDSNIKNSIIKDSIINSGAYVENTVFSCSIIGQNAQIIEKFKQFNIGDSCKFIMD